MRPGKPSARGPRGRPARPPTTGPTHAGAPAARGRGLLGEAPHQQRYKGGLTPKPTESGPSRTQGVCDRWCRRKALHPDPTPTRHGPVPGGMRRNAGRLPTPPGQRAATNRRARGSGRREGPRSLWRGLVQVRPPITGASRLVSSHAAPERAGPSRPSRGGPEQSHKWDGSKRLNAQGPDRLWALQRHTSEPCATRDPEARPARRLFRSSATRNRPSPDATRGQAGRAPCTVDG